MFFLCPGCFSCYSCSHHCPYVITGYLFSLNHAQLVVLMVTIYSLYYVKVQAGWLGVLLSINLAFLSNDLLSCLIQWCDNLSKCTNFEEHKESESFIEIFSTDYEYSTGTDEDEKLYSCKSSSKLVNTSSFVEKLKESAAKHVVKEEVNSISEIKRILSSIDHYEALGFSRQNKVDVMLLKKEYHKKVCLVWLCDSNYLSCLCLHMLHLATKIL